MNYGKIRIVNGNSSCCRPLQGDLDLHRERDRLRERDTLKNWFILHYPKCYGLQIFIQVLLPNNQLTTCN